MPKSCTGSRYTGYSCTSSRLRKVASAVTGPGVTTWRLVRIRPRSASTTKPVACAVAFHSVSKARTRSMSIETTLPAMRSSVTAQSGLASTAAACCAICGSAAPTGGAVSGCGAAGAGTGPAGAGAGSDAAHTAAQPRNAANNVSRTGAKRGGSLSSEEDQQPHRGKQHERHQYRGGADVLGESGERVALEADAVHGRLDGAVDELDDEREQHRSYEERALDAAAAEPQRERDQHHRDRELPAERRLVAERAGETAHARAEGAQHPRHAAGLVPV